MALMKTGRKPYGEDPKKPKTNGDNPKNQQEIKVTAKKQYTWDDVSKSEEIKSRNKAAKQQYESVIILTPVLSEQQMKEAVAGYRELITGNGGELVHEENWGLTKLAYPIQ
jgi:hypothetical protein